MHIELTSANASEKFIQLEETKKKKKNAHNEKVSNFWRLI